MSAPVQTVDDFLAVVRRSGLVEEAKLAPLVAAWVGHAGPPPEPMLAALVDAGVLTRWQIDQLLKGRYKGFTLGKYRLLKLLGAGGSGYLACYVPAASHDRFLSTLPRHLDFKISNEGAGIIHES